MLRRRYKDKSIMYIKRMDLVLNKIENLYQEMTIIECINCGDDCYSKLEKEELIKSGYYCENCEEIIDNIEEYEPNIYYYNELWSHSIKLKKDQEGLKKGYNWYRNTMPSIKYMEFEKKKLKRKIYYMETIIESLGEHLSYMPGGDGYEETKNDYESKLK